MKKTKEKEDYSYLSKSFIFRHYLGYTKEEMNEIESNIVAKTVEPEFWKRLKDPHIGEKKIFEIDTSLTIKEIQKIMDELKAEMKRDGRL